MATASGSIAFLGAARFQGFWNASTNEATGSGLLGATDQPYTNLFDAGDSGYPGGYHDSTLLTASIGHYWQVTGSGTTEVDGHTSWNLNDWVIYSGSMAGSAGSWTRLAYEDTIASIILGSISGDETFHLTGSADKHVLFISGSSDLAIRMSGSDNFTYDHNSAFGRLCIGPGSETGVFGATVTGPYSDLLTLRSDGDAYSAGALAVLETNSNTDSYHSSIGFLKSGGSKGSETVVADDEVVGALHFLGHDGTNYENAASIRALVDGTPNDDATDMPGRIEFQTTPNGSDTVATRMTIKNDGKVGIGTGSPSNKLQVDHTGADGDDGLMIVRADSSTADTDLLGGIGFDSTDGNVPSTITEASVFIAAYAAEAHGAGDKGGDLVFGTSVIDEDDDTTSTEHMRILDSGNVGIGTDSPDNPLELLSSTEPQFRITNTDAVDYATFAVDTDGQLDITTVGGGSNLSHVCLMPEGNVGIGTITPDYTLDVAGDVGVDRYIYHNGDDDTKIEFTSDKIQFTAGTSNESSPAAMLTLWETAIADQVQINTDAVDIDFLVRSTGSLGGGSAMFISGSDGIIHSNYGINIDDGKNLTFGLTSGGPQVVHDPVSNFLHISGSDGGLVLSGSAIVFDGIIRPKADSDLNIASDRNVIFVVDSDDDESTTGVVVRNSAGATVHALVETGDYLLAGSIFSGNASTSDFMHITGTLQGLALSGSNVVVDGYLKGGSSLAGGVTDLKIGSDIVGPEGASFTITSDRNISLKLDKDQAGSTYYRYILNGAGNWVHRIDEAGHVRLVENAILGWGSNADAECFITYEDTPDWMHISGSTNGLVLSGSNVVVDAAGGLIPNVDNVYDLGSASKRWAVAHLGDLHLRNDRGDWTLVEEEDYLSIRNNKTDKLYKFVLEEVEE